ncbi:hypothetical protein OGAPHI_006406 [Ogataea philodendri]|uniref:Peptide chain release factor 1, mitochondrial n=1 Tax=Ogataea philodendri TaxID=1378263 RepID=A0A9P8NX79_9ASCO|nr:uncharacterized protein OGAPHI_006406 [Ogataea philodendri]KAH3661558.1 hypothetical protein OGAPHI_006406 [Ogataea philodendri]
MKRIAFSVWGGAVHRFRLSHLSARAFYSTNKFEFVVPLHPLLLQKAKSLRDELREFENKMLNGEVLNPNDSKHFNSLTHSVDLYDQIEKLVKEISELQEILTEKDQDPSLISEAELEIKGVEAELEKTAENLKVKLLPPIPYSDRPCLIELRPGAGGHEANIFTEDLLEMYIKYCQLRGWASNIESKTEHSSGRGLVEATLLIKQPGSYGRMRHEAGVHRVQRIPETENKGRVHTSAAAVVVLPQIENNNADPEVRKFKPGELKIDVMRASGSGGQHVNTTESAVRITHVPTGITVSIQDERSQLRNREKAMIILRSRLAELELNEKLAKEREQRTGQVSSVDRSDKIRTYNFPQNRLTDHRCGLTLYDLEGCLNGERLDDVIDKVAAKEVEDRAADLISTIKSQS